MIKREDIVLQAAEAVASVFNYYCDQKLDDTIINKAKEYLNTILPQNLTTKRYNIYAKEYDARVISED